LGGATLGCNYQIDHFVAGIEGDAFWSTLQVASNATGGGFGANSSTKNPWTADVAVRVGLAYDRFFIYDKTGATFGRFDFSTTTLGAPATVTSGSATIPGVIQGIGLEYMITPWLSAKAEFDLLVYASQNVNFTCSPAIACGIPTTTSSQPQLEGVGKIGLNYKFW
jgi:outer membrane immunogenic protein